MRSSEAIEALLRACDARMQAKINNAELAAAAAAVRAELAREPVELSDEQLRSIVGDEMWVAFGDDERTMATLRAVARAARGESK